MQMALKITRKWLNLGKQECTWLSEFEMNCMMWMSKMYCISIDSWPIRMCHNAIFVVHGSEYICTVWLYRGLLGYNFNVILGIWNEFDSQEVYVLKIQYTQHKQ